MDPPAPETASLLLPRDSEAIRTIADIVKSFSCNPAFLNAKFADIKKESASSNDRMLWRSFVQLSNLLCTVFMSDAFSLVEEVLAFYRPVCADKMILEPNTIGSFLYGCRMGDPNIPLLSRYCTPICASSLRTRFSDDLQASQSKVCDSRVLWIDGMDNTYVTLSRKEGTDRIDALMFIAWRLTPLDFNGLPTSVIDKLREERIATLTIYALMGNMKFEVLMPRQDIDDVPVGNAIDLARYSTMTRPAPPPAVENPPDMFPPADSVEQKDLGEDELSPPLALVSKDVDPPPPTTGFSVGAIFAVVGLVVAALAVAAVVIIGVLRIDVQTTPALAQHPEAAVAAEVSA